MLQWRRLRFSGKHFCYIYLHTNRMDLGFFRNSMEHSIRCHLLWRHSKHKKHGEPRTRTIQIEFCVSKECVDDTCRAVIILLTNLLLSIVIGFILKSDDVERCWISLVWPSKLHTLSLFIGSIEYFHCCKGVSIQLNIKVKQCIKHLLSSTFEHIWRY